MGWFRKILRPGRSRCRPLLESLETRNLLSNFASNPSSQAPALPTPVVAGGPSGSATPDASDNLIGASRARAQFGVDGTGLTAAVIDTGVNYQNEALGGGFGPGDKVVAGYNFANNTGDPAATTWQHGTAVAGLIASSDPNHPGVAPGAQIVALKVFNDNHQGGFDWVVSALQWVIDNHQQYNISVVNLSISDEGNDTHDWFANDGGVGQKVDDLIQQLDQLNIPVVAAAGNSFQGQQGMGFPAIDPTTISVTATDSSDHLAGNAQRLGSALGGASATDLAAPGVNLTAPADGNNFTTVSGTSFAAPEVSGAVILLQQIYEQRFGHLPTVEQVDSWLTQGSDAVNDPTTGLVLDRLDIPKAASLIPGAPATLPTQTPVAAPQTPPPPAQVPALAPTAPPVPVQTPAPNPAPTPPPVQAPTPPTVVAPTPPPPAAPPAPQPTPTLPVSNPDDQPFPPSLFGAVTMQWTESSAQVATATDPVAQPEPSTPPPAAPTPQPSTPTPPPPPTAQQPTAPVNTPAAPTTITADPPSTIPVTPPPPTNGTTIPTTVTIPVATPPVTATVPALAPVGPVIHVGEPDVLVSGAPAGLIPSSGAGSGIAAYLAQFSLPTALQQAQASAGPAHKHHSPRGSSKPGAAHVVSNVQLGKTHPQGQVTPAGWKRLFTHVGAKHTGR